MKRDEGRRRRAEDGEQWSGIRGLRLNSLHSFSAKNFTGQERSKVKTKNSNDKGFQARIIFKIFGIKTDKNC